MLIVTILSVIVCGAPAALPDGECDRSGSWIREASSYTEATEDWDACLKDRKFLKASKLYDEVECDQFDPNMKPVRF